MPDGVDLRPCLLLIIGVNLVRQEYGQRFSAFLAGGIFPKQAPVIGQEAGKIHPVVIRADGRMAELPAKAIIRFPARIDRQRMVAAHEQPCRGHHGALAAAIGKEMAREIDIVFRGCRRYHRIIRFLAKERKQMLIKPCYRSLNLRYGRVSVFGGIG